MKRRWWKATFVLIFLWAGPAVAQQPASGDGDHELIRQLLQRVQQLEAEVRELKARESAASASTATSSAVSSSTASSTASLPPNPPTPAPTQSAQAPAPFNQGPMIMPDAHGSPSMNFRGFSDVSYHASDQSGTTNAFALGQFNLFITSKLSERIGVLAEAVLEADQNNGFGFELERLLLQYSASDHFNINVGRYHTAIGWYNTAYHHSTWMQTAVGRPLAFDFEDKGGILPVHNVGISVNGTIPSGSLGLHYVAEVGNGRTSRSPLDEPVQNVVDENNGKAVNFALFVRPDNLPGFQAGFSVYHDHLTPAGGPNIGETIFAAHAVYQSSVFEWLNEAVMIRDAINGTSRVDHVPTFYSQISRKIGPVRPYFRYQYINAPDTRFIFPDIGFIHGPSLGIRYDFSDFAAFKIQYDRTDRHQGGVNGITTQLSFAF